MIIRKMRLQKGWSQEQLAEVSGLSIRTIQRLERGHKASLESLKSLAAVFDASVTQLQEDENVVNNEAALEEQKAIEYVRDIKGFYSHLISYVLVMIGLLIINLITSPHNLWVIWPALGWGLGIVSHGLSVFECINFFNANWEKKQVEKRLGRKL